MEELKFEKLSDVAEVAELADGDYLMAVKDGEVVKISKNEVGGKVKRELMHEWDFKPEDMVFEIFENVDDDLTWLTVPSPDNSYEIEIECYQCFFDDEGATPYGEDKTIFAHFNNNRNDSYSANLYGIDIPVFGTWFECFNLHDGNDNAQLICGQVEVFGLIHDGDNEFFPVDKGGIISVSSYELPLKSVRIYKVTK